MKISLLDYLFPEDSDGPSLLGYIVVCIGIILGILIFLSLGAYGFVLIIKSFSEEGFILLAFVKGIIAMSISGGTFIGACIWAGEQ